MKLLELELTNVRAIRHLKLDFQQLAATPSGSRPRSWTVLFGENGCGKTTVLRSIALVLAGSEALSDLIDEPAEWVRKGSAQAKIRARVGSSIEDAVTVELLISRTDRRDSIVRKNSKRLRAIDTMLELDPAVLFVAGYGAFRRPAGASYRSELKHGFTRSRSRAAAVGSLFGAVSELVSIDEWAQRLDYTRGAVGRKLVASSLTAMLPGMRFSRIDKGSGEVLMKTQDGELALHQLSEGYQAMAAWVGDLLFRITSTFSRYKKNPPHPTVAEGILLLDEMDLHLHPVWQRRLVAFLEKAFPNLQVVTTTHSPLAVQQCGEGELFVIRREAGGPSLIPFNGDPKRLRIPDLFLSPLIGLDTLDSPKVAELREEARQIERKPGVPKGQDVRRLGEIVEELDGTRPISVEELNVKPTALAAVIEDRKVHPLERIRRSEKLFVYEKQVREGQRGFLGRVDPGDLRQAARASTGKSERPSARKPKAAKAPTKSSSSKKIVTRAGEEVDLKTGVKTKVPGAKGVQRKAPAPVKARPKSSTKSAAKKRG